MQTNRVPLYEGRREHDVQRKVLRYLIVRNLFTVHRKQDTTTERKMPEINRSALIRNSTEIPSIDNPSLSCTHSLSKPQQQVQVLYADFKRKSGDECSLRSQHTHMFPTEYCTQKRGSSEKPKLCHSCTQQSCRPSLLCFAKRSHTNVCYNADNPRCCNCHRIVRVDTWHSASMPIF